MSFDPKSITGFQLGSMDYPAGEVVLGNYGWHILELILDDDGNWSDKVFLSNLMNDTVEDVIAKFAKNYYLAFELDTTWDEFRPFIEQFGAIPNEISGSLNDEDFEELI